MYKVCIENKYFITVFLPNDTNEVKYFFTLLTREIHIQEKMPKTYKYVPCKLFFFVIPLLSNNYY